MSGPGGASASGGSGRRLRRSRAPRRQAGGGVARPRGPYPMRITIWTKLVVDRGSRTRWRSSGHSSGWDIREVASPSSVARSRTRCSACPAAGHSRGASLTVPSSAICGSLSKGAAPRSETRRGESKSRTGEVTSYCLGPSAYEGIPSVPASSSAAPVERRLPRGHRPHRRHQVRAPDLLEHVPRRPRHDRVDQGVLVVDQVAQTPPYHLVVVHEEDPRRRAGRLLLGHGDPCGRWTRTRPTRIVRHGASARRAPDPVQVQSATSGMSVPCSRIQEWWRVRASAMACRTPTARTPRPGTRSITSITRR